MRTRYLSDFYLYYIMFMPFEQSVERTGKERHPFRGVASGVTSEWVRERLEWRSRTPFTLSRQLSGGDAYLGLCAGHFAGHETASMAFRT
jgi:hypothetical protein